MKEEIRILMREALAEFLDPINDELIEQSARLSAERFLLEIVFANAFLNNEGGFKELMQQLILKTRANAVKAGPMPADSAIELQARIATHLERFQNSVALRILQG